MPVVNMRDIAKGITINVRIDGYESYRIRLWIGILLIRLASWIVGMNFHTFSKDDQ